MTAWTRLDYDRAGDRDADRVTASPPDLRYRRQGTRRRPPKFLRVEAGPSEVRQDGPWRQVRLGTQACRPCQGFAAKVKNRHELYSMLVFCL